MVANSLFITGAKTGQETSEKKEPRKEDGKRCNRKQGREEIVVYRKVERSIR
jgi:hypothetical protein